MTRFQRVASEARGESLVLIVDRDERYRRFLEGVLRRGGFRARSLASGEEAIVAAREERPQLVVLEVHLSDISGYEVCQQLRHEHGGAIAIMFMSGDRTESHDRVAGLMLGADDYLVKPLVPDEWLARVRALARRAKWQRASARPKCELTERELEVLQLLANGLDQLAIAAELVITPKTVGKHIEHILSKLPARSRAEAVAIAYQRGLHSPTRAPAYA